MKTSIIAKQITASTLSLVGAVSFRLRQKYADNFLILMYHRIIPASEYMDGFQAGMYVEPDTFEKHLKYLKKHFKIIPLQALPVNHENQKHSHELKNEALCVLTFDDGWYDFYHYAFPILKKYNAPATVFLPTDFIDSKDWFWTDQLACLFYNGYPYGNNKKTDHPVISQIDKLPGCIDSRFEKAIGILKKYPLHEIKEILDIMTSGRDFEKKINSRAFLTWDETKIMKNSGLISFGSHTAGHQILTTLEKTEIQNELIKSKEKLIAEKAVDPSFIPFCYPNGNYSRTISQMVKNAGYGLAVTTKKGWNPDHADPFTLQRIGMHQDMTSSKAMFGCKIAEII